MHAENAAEYSGPETLVDEASPSSNASTAYESGDEPRSKFNDAVDAVKETFSSAADGASNIARNVTGMGRNANASSDRPRVSDASFTEPKSTIYIGNLFFDVTENDLMKELSRFGNIIKCRLIRDSRGLSKG
jgi:nucleolin